MARFTFAGTDDDYIHTVDSGNVMHAAPGSVLTLWSAITGGTQYTDLLLNGSPVTTITADSRGYVPQFSGPDGIAQMWASADGSARLLFVSKVSSSGFSQVATPEQYGAVGDGTTNDTVAMQAAIDSNLPVKLDPTKTYKVAGLVARTGMHMAGEPLLPGTGYRASLKTTSGDMWTTPSSGTAFVAGFRFENLVMESATASGGHLLRGMWSLGSFSNVDFVQNNNAKSILDVIGMIDVSFSDCQLQHTTSSSVPAFKAVTSTGNLAQVSFTDSRCTNSGTHFFWIEGTAGAVPINIGFTNVNFEVCNGGLAKLLSCRHVTFDRCGAWDFSAAATNHLFHIDKSATAGAAPRAITFRDCIRDASTAPTGGAQDIFNESTAGTTELNVDNCGHQLSGNYLVTAGNATGRVRGAGVTTLTTGLNMSTDDYQPVTVTLTGTGTSVGNGTLTARQQRTGKRIDLHVKFTLGSTSTMGSVLLLTFPTSESTAGVGISGLRVFAIDAATAFYRMDGALATSTTLNVYPVGTGGLFGTPSSTVPFTWGTNDSLEIGFTYEALV